MTKRRFGFLFLVLLMVFVMCASAIASEVGPLTIKDALPIAAAGQEIKLTIFQSLTATVDDLNNNQATDIIEKATGLNLEFISAPAADALTKRNLLLNSGDYPDIISARGMARTEMAMYADQGVFVALDDYLAKAPNASAIFAENEAAKIICTGSDGKIYSLPDINECYHCLYGNGRSWFYRPFMDSINKGVLPQTTEELKTYLQAVKDSDANGNGVADEIPLAFNKDGVDRFTIWVSNFFTVYPSDHYRLEKDGAITPVFTTPEYKEALKYANDLYKSGLILEEGFSILPADLVKIGEDPAGARLGLIIGWGPEDGVKKAGESKRWFEYYAMSPVAGPTGQRNHVYSGDWGSVLTGFFVTDKCQFPQEAVQLGDLLLSEYFGYTTYIGPKGVSWDDPTEGALGFNGQPARFKELVAYGTQAMNSSWDQQSITNRPADFRMAQEAEGVEKIYAYLKGDFSLRDEAASFKSYNEIMKYSACQTMLDPYKFDEAYIVPSLLYDPAVADIVADAEAVITPYRQQMIAAFVTGTSDIEAEFDNYVAELNKMGLQDIVDAKTNAYKKLIAK